MKSCPFPTGNTLHKIWCDARWLVFANEMREFREFSDGLQWSDLYLSKFIIRWDDEPLKGSR